MVYPLAPEPVDALINFLKTDAPIVAFSADRVSTVKIDTPSPRIQITQIPGQPTEAYEEFSEFQLDCWGSTNPLTGEREARTLARTVCTRINAMRGAVTGGAVVNAYATVKPFDLPDPITGRPRSVCQVGVSISPTSP